MIFVQAVRALLPGNQNRLRVLSVLPIQRGTMSMRIQGSNLIRDKRLATLLFFADLLAYRSSWTESKQASKLLLVHTLAGGYEICLGWLGLIFPHTHWLRQHAIWVALLHIPTNILLSLHLRGVGGVTISSFLLLRLYRILMYFQNLLSKFTSTCRYPTSPTVHNFEKSWILLHMTAVARFVSAYVVPVAHPFLVILVSSHSYPRIQFKPARWRSPPLPFFLRFHCPFLHQS